MDGVGIGLQLVIVAALAASVRYVQAPCRVSGRVFGWDIETVRIVAVVARCIGFGFVIRIGAGVKRFFIGLNVLGDRRQARFFARLAVGLGFLPKALMAASAIYLL